VVYISPCDPADESKDIWQQAPPQLHDTHHSQMRGNHQVWINRRTTDPIYSSSRLPIARILDGPNLQLLSLTLCTTATMLGLAGMQPRQLAAQVLNFALVLSTAFMLWKGLSVVSNSPSPIVVVLSGSMEPAFQRGDLLFLWNRGLDTQIGEIVVYNVKGKDIPIVHRVVRRYGGGWVFLLLV
jgi:hypothetical protein